VVIASLGTWPFDLKDEALAGIEAIELRVDLMGLPLSDLPDVVSEVVSRVPRVIVACRPGMSEPDRVALLVGAVRLDVWAVDVEIDGLPPRAPLWCPPPGRAAARSSCRFTITGTPPEAHAAANDPPVARCRRGSSRSHAACEPLPTTPPSWACSTINRPGGLRVLGVGPLGRVCRIVAPLIGSRSPMSPSRLVSKPPTGR
jgi:hypothetical protein